LPGRERVGAAASRRLAPLCRRDLLGDALAGPDGAVDEAAPHGRGLGPGAVNAPLGRADGRAERRPGARRHERAVTAA
jgi:hypothetical protein